MYACIYECMKECALAGCSLSRTAVCTPHCYHVCMYSLILILCAVHVDFWWSLRFRMHDVLCVRRERGPEKLVPAPAIHTFIIYSFELSVCTSCINTAIVLIDKNVDLSIWIHLYIYINIRQNVYTRVWTYTYRHALVQTYHVAVRQSVQRALLCVHTHTHIHIHTYRHTDIHTCVYSAYLGCKFFCW
jgi:hypothetical protein